MGREARRAQARAERRQRQQQQQARVRPSTTPSTGGGRQEPSRRGSLLRPRWAMDIISELRKVTWPNRQEVFHLSTVVVVVALIIGAILGTADLVFGWFVEQTILR
jgi:preprotein translocase SecE subunit